MMKMGWVLFLIFIAPSEERNDFRATTAQFENWELCQKAGSSIASLLKDDKDVRVLFKCVAATEDAN